MEEMVPLHPAASVPLAGMCQGVENHRMYAPCPEPAPAQFTTNQVQTKSEE
ncbi:anaphase-promoting complex component Cut20/Apc4 [Anopheles sinensis]|uniref:Anaphase-promoting complex component Cut20/Apc4 n=1 Tax=Anopheles sinensis TaxID=74873 RepID=A0A084WH93_ANOSI|nr:anaphase-promoting complex component Cut20/Apc4 [Anopheles sinensis]